MNMQMDDTVGEMGTTNERGGQVSENPQGAEAHKRRKQHDREYYWKNREVIRARQKIYFSKQDKAKNAERKRIYRSEKKKRTPARNEPHEYFVQREPRVRAN